jgi:glycosyltransferase involved in cell wall biosynthesis
MESPHHGNQVNPPQSPNTPDRLVAAAYSTGRLNDTASKDGVVPGAAENRLKERPLALLLDLSSDKSAAIEWASTRLPDVEIRQINKVDLKWKSKSEALARVRSLEPNVFCVFTSDLNLQRGLSSVMLFAIIAGARRIVIGDRYGRAVSRTRLGVLLLEVPRFVLEVAAGYGLLVPLSWLLTEMLRISLAFRAPVRASRITKRRVPSGMGPALRAIHVRATLSSGAEGGMPTHVAGFAGGAAALGHGLAFLVSGTEIGDQDHIVIAPSRLLSATKALFELWNNIVFTVKSLRLVASGALSSNQFDFIYQRYSRFNWTGVVLSVLTGLPLVLEFNGSEVWVSRQWDPIGQLWLLNRFERLNQRAADFIFVVSDVQRRGLAEANVPSEKVIVNPNGADTDVFRPDIGGREVRRRFGIEDKTVIGFIGTFGPWHGAPVLAQAARVLAPDVDCHFLFIGDGEERAQTESIIEAAGVSATFTGRVSHREVPAHLDACDILVSPQVPSTDGSEFFGSPTKLFEYMSMAKPIIASRLGQIAEVIADGQDGLLVEPGDANALARVIEKLAHDEALRTRLGAAARQKVIERYTWKKNAARVFDEVRSTLHGDAIKSGTSSPQ